MLSDEIIEKVTERLVRRIEQGNEYILQKIGENIKKIGVLSPSEVRQIEQILKYGGDYNKIVKKLSEITNLNVKEIYKIFDEVAKSDYNFTKQYFDFRNKKFIPYDENFALKNQVEALAQVTAKEYVKMTKKNLIGLVFEGLDNKTKFKGLKKAYYEAIDIAILNVAQGKETFDTAVYKLINEMGGSGIKLKYASGRTMRFDSAVKMTVRGALRDLHMEVQKTVSEQFDGDGWEVSVHPNPAPDHADVQGHQFRTKEYEKFQNDRDSKDVDGIVFSASHEGRDRRSIGQYNCYHYAFAIVVGVSKPLYSKEELQNIIEENNKQFEFDGKKYTKYQGTQLQRQIERNVRELKDKQILAKASDRMDIVEDTQNKIKALNKKYNELSEVSGLKKKNSRMRVSGFKK